MTMRTRLLPVFLLPAFARAFLGQWSRVAIAVSRATATPANQEARGPTISGGHEVSARASAAATARMQMASNPTAVSRDNDLATFLQWAADEMGVKAPGLKGAFEGGLRGLVATKTMSAKEEIVTVPSESALVTTTDQPCPFPAWVSKDYWATSPWQVRLALLLLHEKKRGTESELLPWISRLPTAFGTPVAWSAAELAELQYPFMEQAARQQRQEWADFHSSLMSSSPGCEVTQEEFWWAMGVAFSRAFSGPYEGRGPKERLAELAFVVALAGGSVGLGLGTVDQVANGALAVLIGIPLRDFLMTRLVQLKRYALTPVVDLFNHDSSVQSDVSFNYFYGYFAVTTERTWEAGQQVFISYGPRSNDELLQRYGFVEPDNPHDVYRITGVISKLSKLLGEESVAVLRKSGPALGKEPVEAVVVGRGGIKEEEAAKVMPALRLAVVKDEQLPAGKAGDISLQDFKDEVSPSNERAARRVLGELCVQERGSFGTSLEEDEKRLSTLEKAFGATTKLALAFRMEKKKVLDAAIAALANGVTSKDDSTAAPSSSTAFAR